MMNYVKASLGFLCAIFFFALGIYFQGSLPMPVSESTREPASFAATGARGFDAKATEAFKACIDSKVKKGSVKIGKVSVEGRRWSIVSIPCVGTPAKELFDSIQPYSTEELVHYRDTRQGVVRFFGRLYPPSQCVQLIGDAKGKVRHEYSCSIRIDVDSEITEQLKL